MESKSKSKSNSTNNKNEPTPTVVVKFFRDVKEDDEKFEKLWNENKHRMIHFEIWNTKWAHTLINYRLKEELKDSPDKDILPIKYVSRAQLSRNKILNRIIYEGIGINYDEDKVWYPKEIWVMNPYLKDMKIMD